MTSEEFRSAIKAIVDEALSIGWTIDGVIEELDSLMEDLENPAE